MNKSSAIKQIKISQPTVIIQFYFLHQKDGLSLRYFYEEIPELHIIAAGSMLEFSGE